MGELEEIGRRSWSGKSQLLTGWLCDGWVLVWGQYFQGVLNPYDLLEFQAVSNRLVTNLLCVVLPATLHKNIFQI